MLELFRRRRLLILTALSFGVVFRLWLIFLPLPYDDDTSVYSSLALNWFHYGVYGLSDGDVLHPTLIRLPGYPLFLGLIYAISGAEHLHAVMFVQLLVDMLGCLLIAEFLREWVSERAAIAGLWLSVACVSTACYVATGLTECLSIFCVSLSIFAAGRLVKSIEAGRPVQGFVVLLGLGLGYSMLLRPDGALLAAAVCPAVVWYGFREGKLWPALRVSVLAGGIALLMLVPWTARNVRTFHVIEPLAPRHVNDPGEYVTLGFYRWLRTWDTDFIATANVFWKVGSEPIDIEDVSWRAFDSPQQRAETENLIERYNRTEGVDPSMDAEFARIATERVKANPLRYYLQLPLLRIADMWLRPRTEMLDLDLFWWRYGEHPKQTVIAWLMVIVNLGYLALALLGVFRGRVPLAGMLLAFLLMRCVLLGTLENPEPRYTVECYPAIFLFAAAAIDHIRGKQTKNPARA